MISTGGAKNGEAEGERKENQRSQSRGSGKPRDFFEEYIKKFYEKEKRDNGDIEIKRYIFQKLHEKGLESTNVEKLLDVVIQESKIHMEIKQNMETRVGLILALWGVILSMAFQEDLPKIMIQKMLSTGSVCYAHILGIILTGQMITGILFFAFAIKSLGTSKYAIVSLKDSEINLKAAVDDKYVSILRLFDSYMKVWVENLKGVREKGKYYKRLMKALVGFVVFVILGYFCTLV